MKYDSETGLPISEAYLEKGLSDELRKSIAAMQRSWETMDRGQKDLHWDIYWCNLNADLNAAEVEQEISKEQADYLRRKYLRMEDI